MAPAFGAVIATPERRALRASASGERLNMSARIEAGRPRPLWARLTRAGPACRTRPNAILRLRVTTRPADLTLMATTYIHKVEMDDDSFAWLSEIATLSVKRCRSRC